MNAVYCILGCISFGFLTLMFYLIERRKKDKEIESIMQLLATESQYRHKAVEVENAYNMACEDGMELACKLSDKEREIRVLTEKIDIYIEINQRQAKVTQVFADKLIANGINVTAKEVDEFKSAQWGEREYQHYISKLNQ